MALDIGPKIGIDGEQQFRSSIQSINTSLKTLASEAKMVQSSFTEQTTAEEKAAKMSEVLTKQIDAQKQKLDKLKEGLQASADKYGETDERTQKWQQAVNNAQTELNKMEQELKKTTDATDKMGDEVKDTDKSLTDIKKDTHDTGEELDKAGKNASTFGDTLKAHLTADAIKAGAQKLLDLTKQIASGLKECAEAGAVYGDEMMTMSQKTGLSTKTLQEYEYMAGLVDVSLDTITGSLTKIQKSMTSAAKGTGDAYEAYEQLGVSITDANGEMRKADDVFDDLIDALGKIDNETTRDTMAMTLMGKSAKDLNPLIKTGTKQLNAFRKEANDVGYVLSNTQLKALQKAKDAMDRLDKATEGAKNQFAVGLAPALEESRTLLADKINSPKVQKALKDLSESLGGALVKAANFAADAIDFVIDTVNLLTGNVTALSDKEYDLILRTDSMADSFKDLKTEFDDSAIAIVSETWHVQDLWAELQTLADEEGNVEDGNHDRAQQILNELNSALGTEYEMNGNLITQYQTMQDEIDELIKKKQAEALLAVHQERYSEALTGIEQARKDVAQYERSINNLNRQIEALEYNRSLWQEEFDEGSISESDFKSINLHIDEKIAPYANALKELNQNLEQAQQLESDLTHTIYTQSEAQAAILRGEYDIANSLLLDSVAGYEDYASKRGKITREQKDQVYGELQEMEQIYADYQKHVLAGDKGYTQETLDRYGERRDELRKIEKAIIAGAEEWADIYAGEMNKGFDLVDFEGYSKRIETMPGIAEQAMNQFVASVNGGFDEVATHSFDVPQTVDKNLEQVLLLVGERGEEIRVTAEDKNYALIQAYTQAEATRHYLLTKSMFANTNAEKEQAVSALEEHTKKTRALYSALAAAQAAEVKTGGSTVNDEFKHMYSTQMVTAAAEGDKLQTKAQSIGSGITGSLASAIGSGQESTVQSLRQMAAAQQFYMDQYRPIMYNRFRADGNYTISGIVAGMTSNTSDSALKQAAYRAYRIVEQSFREAARINSPSKEMQEQGAGLIEGLVKGMDDGESALRAASQRMADASMSGTYSSGTYRNATMSSNSSVGGSTSYSTYMGGITVNVSGTGVANVDQLADRIAVKLNNQIRRAQRAR